MSVVEIATLPFVLCGNLLICEKNVSLTYPHTQVCVTFLVPKPNLLPEAAYVFQPLHLTLWILIVVAVILTCFVVRFLTYVGERNQINSGSMKFSDSIIPILYGIRIFTMGSVKRRIPSGLTYLRIMFLAFAFTCLCLSTAYSAGFASSLTYPRYYGL